MGDPPHTSGLNGLVGLWKPGCGVAGLGAPVSDVVSAVFVDCLVVSFAIVADPVAP